MLYDDILDDDGDGLEYRATAATSGATTSCPKPSGVAVGDVVIVLVPTTVSGLTLTTSTGSAWSRSEISWGPPHGYYSVLFAKVLTATDVANAWTFSAADDARAHAWIGGDGTGVTIRSPTVNSANGSATLSLAGFTAANTHAVIAAAVDRDTDGVPGTPAGFTSRFNGLNGEVNFTEGVADSDAYTGGAVVWTNMDAGASDFSECGWLVEVTF